MLKNVDFQYTLHALILYFLHRIGVRAIPFEILRELAEWKQKINPSLLYGTFLKNAKWFNITFFDVYGSFLTIGNRTLSRMRTLRHML